ncbi:MAG: hypothetical protein UR26_C0004G0039 [candidate division TM6 bacterium GW2011_GWF2_32_72]|nr:MAG: hypothetical protein UR26_C0004G0039 [candidate division TM6 bacterium GW2011_GWF2_32_72]
MLKNNKYIVFILATILGFQNIGADQFLNKKTIKLRAQKIEREIKKRNNIKFGIYALTWSAVIGGIGYGIWALNRKPDSESVSKEELENWLKVMAKQNHNTKLFVDSIPPVSEQKSKPFKFVGKIFNSTKSFGKAGASLFSSSLIQAMGFGIGSAVLVSTAKLKAALDAPGNVVCKYLDTYDVEKNLNKNDFILETFHQIKVHLLEFEKSNDKKELINSTQSFSLILANKAMWVESFMSYVIDNELTWEVYKKRGKELREQYFEAVENLLVQINLDVQMDVVKFDHLQVKIDLVLNSLKNILQEFIFLREIGTDGF